MYEHGCIKNVERFSFYAKIILLQKQQAIAEENLRKPPKLWKN